jgi:hypothetical protein
MAFLTNRFQRALLSAGSLSYLTAGRLEQAAAAAAAEDTAAAAAAIQH